MEIWKLCIGTVPAPTPCTLLHLGWLLIYKATMQLLLSKLRTGEIVVVSIFFMSLATLSQNHG